jgi:chemotaxis response regulator CheB
MPSVDDTAMSDNAPVSNGPGVALLFEDADLSAHLRQALVEAGARIVHEGPATKATRGDLSDNGADVVVVNLDARVEEHLDALYDIFDESRQRVVFNDAEASSGLSGWDQARWARHLAAKLLDGHDVDPPRPAEARSIESRPTELTLPEDEMPEAPPDEARPAADTGGKAGQDTDLTAELEALLAEDGDLLGRAEGDGDAHTRDSLRLDMGDSELSDGDLDAIGAIPGDDAGQEPESPSAGEASAQADGETTPGTGAAGETATTSPTADGDEDSAFDETLRMFDQALAENERQMQEEGLAAGEGEQDPHAEAEKLFQGETTDASDGDEPPAPAPREQEPGDHEAGPAEEKPTLELADHDSPAPQAEPAKPEATLAEDAGSSLSLVDLDEDSSSAGKIDASKAPDAPEWNVLDYEDMPKSPSGMHIMQQNRKEAKVDPSEFGIEKMSASEYLSPDDNGSDQDTPIEPGMNLELEPMEQAVAPKMIEDGRIGGQAEAPLGINPEAGVRRAVVVAAGSSEESRSSLRDFLAAIDRVPDAAIIAVVHQQAGDDLEKLAAECNSTSPVMPVRVAEAEGRARHGEMILVPVGKQAALQANGQLQMLDSVAQPLANPSIDLTMTLVAQEFGENTLAIVLAGDAIDALAGAQAVSDGGGRVWTVDPADCSDNIMVSVLSEEQLAGMTGTPQELAARMLEELS